MKSHLKQGWRRFKSAVPATERKLQLILAAAAASFGGMAAIAWPVKLQIVGVAAGYAASACGGMALLLQFAMQTQTIVKTESQLSVTATNTVTTTQAAAQ